MWVGPDYFCPTFGHNWYSNTNDSKIGNMLVERRGRLVVTGGSGFIGRNLLDTLKGSPHEVISVSRENSVEGVENIHEDLTRTNFDFLKPIDPEYVAYLATISSPKEAALKKQESYDTNVTAVQRFLERAKDLHIKKIVLLSSVVLYSGDGDKPYKEDSEIAPFRDTYNLSKFFLEGLANYYRQNYGLPITIFRLSNTYGPYQTTERVPLLIPKLFEEALEKGKLEVWNTKPVRDWVFVGDVCEVIVRELAAKGHGTFNLGTGRGRSVKEVIEIISKLTGVHYQDLDKPVDPPLRVVCDMAKLRAHLKYVPNTSLEEGLQKTFEFHKSRKK